MGLAMSTMVSAHTADRTATADQPEFEVPRHLEYPDIPAWGLMDRAAELMPGRLACHYNDLEWSWEELNLDAMRCADMLRRLGIEPGDRVGILLPNCPEYIIALNGIWRAGGIAVAISPLSVVDDVDRLLELTECRTVICLDMLAHLLTGQARPERTLYVSLRPRLPLFQQIGYLFLRRRRTGSWWLSVSDRVSWFWDEMKEAVPVRTPRVIQQRNDPAYILATGGTTGDPKAVTLSHGNLVSNAWQQYYWAGGVIGKESMLAVLPFFHSYGLSATVLSGAACVASLYLDHRFSVRQTIRLIEKHRPTIFHAVPAMLVALNAHLRRYPADLSSLKWVMSGGASLPQDVAREFASHTGGLVVEGYGLSEASPVTHAGPLNFPSEPGTIGLPMPDTECRIVSPEDETTDVPDGETGELLVRGPQVMLGYWKNEEATRQAIRDGWLYTGDLAVRQPDGFYRIVERKKDLIITSGFNVYPQEVEEALLTCPGVAEAAVVGVPDEKRGELVKAFLVMESRRLWDEDAIMAWCRKHLAAHKRPRVIEHCPDGLPRNFLGKLLRRKLREPEAASQAPAEDPSSS